MIAIAVTTTSAIASAQRDAGYSVSVEEGDPSGCLRDSALYARVRRWLRRTGAHESVADLHVDVYASGDPVVFTVSREGEKLAERRFAGLPARCADRLDAVAVAIALALEHLAAGGTPETIPEPEGAESEDAAAADAPASDLAHGQEPAAPAPARPPDEPAPVDGVEAPADSSDPTVRVHAGVALLAEVLPDPVLALGVGGELRHGRLHFAFTLFGTAEQERALGDGRSLTRLVGARARACQLEPAWVFGIETCAGLAGGLAFAEGRDFAPNHSTMMGWVAPLLRGGLRYPRGGAISVGLAFEAMLHLVRPQLTLNGSEEKQNAGPIGGLAGLELSVGIP